MQLRDLKPGQKGVVKGFLPGNQEYRKKLFPLGDPIEIKLRGSFISVRKAEIEIIDVYPL